MRIEPWQAVLVPVGLSVVLVASEIPAWTWSRLASMSLASGVAAFSLMALAAILAARWSFVESWFGGLDRVYRTHKWLGVSALALASCHFVFKAHVGRWDMEPIWPLPSYYARMVRQFGFVALMFIVLLALDRNIRYDVWRWWHKLSGVVLLVVTGHWLTVKSPIALASPAGLWLAALAVAGLAAAAYKLLLYPFLANHAEYRLAAITPGKGAAVLRFEPVGQGVAVRPGQFGFLRMKEQGLREPHPFTIAGGNATGEHVDFVVRALGDYTSRLVEKARPGMHAEIYGPHGRFSRRPDAAREIWVAGGVGITPFLAWLHDARTGDLEKVTLFYCYAPDHEFPEAASVAALARQGGADFVAVPHARTNAEFARRFGEIARQTAAARIHVSCCGPRELLQRVRQLMEANRLPQTNLHSEYFEFR